MAALYVQSTELVKAFHVAENGYRYATTFEIKLSGSAFTTILVNVLWNQEKKLVKGSTTTETAITGAALTISESGIGWAEVNDIPGEDAWVDFSKNIIRFSKRFALKLPIAPAVSAIPKVGSALADLGATNNWRVEVEGYVQVNNPYEGMAKKYTSEMKVRIY